MVCSIEIRCLVLFYCNMRDSIYFEVVIGFAIEYLLFWGQITCFLVSRLDGVCRGAFLGWNSCFVGSNNNSKSYVPFVSVRASRPVELETFCSK